MRGPCWRARPTFLHFLSFFFIIYPIKGTAEVKCFERFIVATLEVNRSQSVLRLADKTENPGRRCLKLRKRAANLVYRALDERGQILFEAQEWVNFNQFHDVDPGKKDATFRKPEKTLFNLSVPVVDGRVATSLELHFLELNRKRVLTVKL